MAASTTPGEDLARKSAIEQEDDDFKSVSSVDSGVLKTVQGPTGREVSCQTEKAVDEQGNHYLITRDGVVLRWRLLLGGPKKNNHVDPQARTAICLHGLGDDLGWWEEKVFCTKEPEPECVKDDDGAADTRRTAAKAARRSKQAKDAAAAAANQKFLPEDPLMAEMYAALKAHEANKDDVAWVTDLTEEVELAPEAVWCLQSLSSPQLQKFIEGEKKFKAALPKGNHKQHLRVIYYLIGQVDGTFKTRMDEFCSKGGMDKLREMEAESEAKFKAEAEEALKTKGEGAAGEAEKSTTEVCAAPAAPLLALVPKQAEISLQTPGPPPDARHRLRLTQELAKNMNVILLDQRGFGLSGRPQTAGSLDDQAITCLLTYRVTDMASFTKAIRTDNEFCRLYMDNWSHSASVAGDVAVVRVEHKSVSALGKYLREQETRTPHWRYSSSGVLLRAEVMGNAVAMKSASSLLGAEFAASRAVFLYSGITDGFTSDRLPGPTGSEVVVVHTFRLCAEDPAPALESFCARSLPELRADPLCISFAMSRCGRRLQALGKFVGHAGAMAHLQRFQGWMAPSGDGFSACVEHCLGVQLHARSAELRSLQASQGWESASRDPPVQLLQVFPASFHKGKPTKAAPSLDILVQDVQEVLADAGVSRATVVGHSMGAPVAMRTAIDFPQSVERLCTSAASSKVGEAAAGNWALAAGDFSAWNENTIRSTVSKVFIADDDINGIEAPTLLIHARDDALTDVLGSEMLRERLLHAELHDPDFGGHDCLVASNLPLERLVRFMLAPEALLFADDSLFGRAICSPWNLLKDASLVQYRLLGEALAAVQRAERTRRRKGLADADGADSGRPRAADAGQRAALQKAGIDARATSDVPSCAAHGDLVVLLRTRMKAMEKAMSVPGLDAVRASAGWWCDPGRASSGYQAGKYTVDAWGRRRGACPATSCAWFRWDPRCLPASARESLGAGSPADTALPMYACWWCGARAEQHEDLGAKGRGEEPGAYPGLGEGLQKWWGKEEPAPEGDAVLQEAHQRLLRTREVPGNVDWIKSLCGEFGLPEEVVLSLQMLPPEKLSQVIAGVAKLRDQVFSKPPDQHTAAVLHLVSQLDKSVKPLVARLLAMGGEDSLQALGG